MRISSDEENEGLIQLSKIDPYYKIALKVAKESPCVRRKYGAVIVYEDGQLTSANNSRVSRICDHACVRDRAGLINGSRTELGAEVHAEQAALIDSYKRGTIFVLAGWQVVNGFELIEIKGTLAYPCLVCARMIKYEGYKWVHLMNEELEPVHIEDIIKYRELELGPHYE